MSYTTLCKYSISGSKWHKPNFYGIGSVNLHNLKFTLVKYPLHGINEIKLGIVKK